MRPAIVVAAQLLDGATFPLAVAAAGVGGELNPLGGFYAALGLGGILLVKETALALILPILARLGGRWWLVPAWMGTLGAATNVAAAWR